MMDKLHTGLWRTAGAFLCALICGAALTAAPSPAAAANPGEFAWDDRFAYSGLNDRVLVLTAANGTVYAGGLFTEAGGRPAASIAQWTGRTWAPVGGGVATGGSPGPVVNDLLAVGSDLYVGGFFTSAGAVAASNVVRWDGSAWHPLGNGLGNEVFALVEYQGDIVAAGKFRTASGVTALRVARWDGSQWFPLGDGFGTLVAEDATVFDLLVDGDDLIAAGIFEQAGADTVHNLARWDGVSWSAMDGGTDGPVNTLALFQGEVYAGGNFTLAGGNAHSYLVRWSNGWNAVPGGSPNGIVHDLAVDGGLMLAVGNFASAGGAAVQHAALFNGVGWQPLANGLSERAHAAALAPDGTLYVGGDFRSAGSRLTHHAAGFRDGAWFSLGEGIEGEVRALTQGPRGLYAGGDFIIAGGQLVNSVALWNGDAWEPLGAGVGGVVNAVAVHGPRVYVGGTFQIAGLLGARNIAVWDGGEWSALGSGVDGTVTALAVNDAGILFAGGSFLNAGAEHSPGVAAWDGSLWSPLGTGILPTFQVNALTTDGPDLIVGGLFSAAGGVDAFNTARWNGSEWSALGAGMDDRVRALASVEGRLYAGGDFALADGNQVDGLAVWTGTAWSAVPAVFDQRNIFALAAFGDSLVVGGVFGQVNATEVSSVALYDGAGWCALDGGVEGTVRAVSVSPGQVAVGGLFSGAGAGPAWNIAVGGEDPVVPVRVAGFAATRARRGSGAVLSWSVAGGDPGPGAFAVFMEERGVRTPRAVTVTAHGFGYRAVDPEAPAGPARYWLAERSRAGEWFWHGAANLPAAPVLTLRAAVPNPFAAAMEFAYATPAGSPARVEVYDARGRWVRTLVDLPEGGEGTARWDGRDARGRAAPAGVYLYRLQSEAGVRARKVVRLP